MRNVGESEFDVTVGMAHIAGIGITDINGAEIEALLLEIMAELLALVMEKLLMAAAAVVGFNGGWLPVAFTSMNSLLEGRFRLRFAGSSAAEAEAEAEPAEVGLVVVGIFRVPLTDMAMAGTVPVPVAAMMAGSACSKSQRTVSPSDLWPSSRVSWKTLAAHVAGIRILRPRPSTLVWRSFVEDLLVCGGGAIGLSSAVSDCSSLSVTVAGDAI